MPVMVDEYPWVVKTPTSLHPPPKHEDPIFQIQFKPQDILPPHVFGLEIPPVMITPPFYHGRPPPETFLDRYGQLDHLKTGGPSEISFVHNHRLLRATKIYLNIYHLWPKWVNGVLYCCGLSGGYHSAIEICGKEYQFRGCPNVKEGIFETHPGHSLNTKVATSGMASLSAAEKEIFTEVGRMKKHIVLGLWSGGKIDFDLLMCSMRDQGGWKGPNYKMLTFNCNHFVLEVCERLLQHSCFHPAKGMTSKEKMVPKCLFRLTDVVKKCCVKSVTKGLDEDIIPPASGQVFAFRGRAYKVGNEVEEHNPMQLNTGVIKESLTSVGLGSSRNVSSAVSSSVVSSNTTIDFATSSGTTTTQQSSHRTSRGAGPPNVARPNSYRHGAWSVQTDPSGLQQYELFRRIRDRDRDLDRDGKVTTVLNSSCYNSAGSETESAGKQQARFGVMCEITEEVTPISSQRSDLSNVSKSKTSRSPSIVSPRTEPAFEGPTRLIGYKSLEDVRWLGEAVLDTTCGGNGNGSDNQRSSKSTSSSRSKPPSLGIGVEMRAKLRQELDDDDEGFATRQPSSMDRDIDLSLLGMQMTHRFVPHVSSSTESLTVPMNESEVNCTRPQFDCSSGETSIMRASTDPIPRVIGNPTFLHSGELTPSDFESGQVRGSHRAVYSE